ncbi:peptidase associated/transthyretin-like domain-containing protein [Roseivirga spongicola]|uniref:carboxypeptidase-like regulatory domain-containing protein n=1 Tax=Roseivirga spongicola TaxID=333140 RepID=UPI002AC990A5|nr:carboxypeptidase-like regulatory domain-containing protein [Roseivirga spongicola]WPZ11340.1 carboxypeptidase-like regulatory domain-containing protein [Roseivirga spongicola]
MRLNLKSTFVKISLLTIVFAVILSVKAQAQEQEKLHVVQVSGLVMNSDSTMSIPGVHIYDQRGRGIPTDFKGWFSKAFIAGDTLTISAIGFKNEKVVVPDSLGDRATVIFALEEEVTQLADVEVNPFPSEELFKEAILAMNLSQEQENVLNSYEPGIIQELVRTMPLEGSPSMNYRYMMNQQFQNLQNSTGPRTNPLLNPFAWAQFINSLKKKK